MRATRESPSAKYAKSTATESRNIQFATAGRTEMLAAGNFGDWHAAVGEVPMNSHGKLVLWNSQIITQQP